MKRNGTSQPVAENEPSVERRGHTSFVREIFTGEHHGLVARHRTQTVLTPIARRRAILEEIADKPQTVQLRSVRRRLTALDRALDDRQAECLDRLTTCMIRVSNVGCVNYLKSEVRSGPSAKLPFDERNRQEIGAMGFVLKSVTLPQRAALETLAHLLDPSSSTAKIKLPDAFIAALSEAADPIAQAYDTWNKRQH